jgi:hypothetical protein
MLLAGAPRLGEYEKSVLPQIIDANWGTRGDHVRRFERAFFARKNGVVALRRRVHARRDPISFGPLLISVLVTKFWYPR